MLDSDDTRDDRDILERFYDGNTDAFAVMHSRHNQFVLRLVRKYGASRVQFHDELDVSQAVWLKIWKWVEKTAATTENSFVEVLGTVTHRVTAEFLRGLNRQPEQERQFSKVVDPRHPRALEWPDADEFTRYVIGRLSEPMRTIVNSYYFRDLTPEQIAVLPEVNSTSAAVSSRLHRWKDKTRQQFSSDLGGEVPVGWQKSLPFARTQFAAVKVGTSEWEALTNRRADLIYKKNRTGLTEMEAIEFAELQNISRAAIAAFGGPSRSLEATLAVLEGLPVVGNEEKSPKT